LELGGGGLAFHVAARVGAAAGGNLRDAEGKGVGAHLGGLAGAHDDAGVGHGEAEDGDDALEVVIGDRVGRIGGDVGAVGGLEPGHADGVGPDAVHGFEVADVLHEGEDFEAVVIESKKDADPEVVNAALIGPVHGGEPPEEVGLGSGGVHFFISGQMIGFLEALEGADLAFLELAELVNGKGGDVAVDAADFALALADPVDGFDGLEDVFEALVRIGLPGHDQDPLVAPALELADFLGNLVLGEGPGV